MKILAALDGTESSQTVIDSLIGVKWPVGTCIKLLHVLKIRKASHRGFLHLSPVGPGGGLSSDERQMIKDTVAALQDIAKEIAREIKSDIEIICEVGRGDPKKEIVEEARSFDADTIIMGGRDTESDVPALGSVSQAVLLHSPCPVILCRSADWQQGIQNILFAVDDSPYSKAALQWLKRARWGDETRVKLLTVIAPQDDDNVNVATPRGLTTKMQLLNGIAGAALQEMAAELSVTFGHDNVTTQIGRGDPREVILHTQAAWGADLIVLGAHGKTGLTRLMLGSVSQSIAGHAPCAVAVVRGIVPPNQVSGNRKTGMFALPDMDDAVPDRPPPSNDNILPHITPGGF